MKKLFTIVAFALSSLSLMAEEYTCPLKIFVEENIATHATQTVTATAQANGKYALSLKNFKMGAQAVGNIEVKDIDAYTASNNVVMLSTQQTIQITDGDDPSVKTWMGPGLGNVPILLRGEINGTTMNAILNISMDDPESSMNVRVELGDVTNIGQIPNSNFETFHEEKKSSFTKENQADHWHSFMNCTGGYASTAQAKHCWQSTDTRTGSKGKSSLEIKSRAVKVMGVTVASANGTVTTGRIQADKMDANSTSNCSFLDITKKDKDKKGDPYYTLLNSKPDAIEVWVKYTKGARNDDNKDNVHATISAAITDGSYYQDPTDTVYTNVVATAKKDNIESTGTWEKIDVPFNYTSNTIAPKAILVTISTCSVPGGGSLSDKDGEQDDMFIDDLSLVYNAEMTSLKFKGQALEFNEEDQIYSASCEGKVTPADIEVETNSKSAYVTKSLFDYEGNVVAIINVVSNDLKTANRYVLLIEGATTGIKAPQSVTLPNGIQAIYNLAGQQVGSMTPGQVYIIKTSDGQTKKVIKK